MNNLAVQAVGIVCICVLVLLQIHSVFAVYHDDSNSVRPVKGQTKLCRNLLDILIIYLISKKQIVQVVPVLLLSTLVSKSNSPTLCAISTKVAPSHRI